MADLKKIFDGGKVVMTRNVADKMAENMTFFVEVNMFLGSHFGGNWGDLSDEDYKRNDEAIKNGSRILSAYETSQGKIWIITEAENDEGHREATTILFPNEY